METTYSDARARARTRARFSWYLIILSFYVQYSLATELEMPYSHISLEVSQILTILRIVLDHRRLMLNILPCDYLNV